MRSCPISEAGGLHYIFSSLLSHGPNLFPPLLYKAMITIRPPKKKLSKRLLKDRHLLIERYARLDRRKLISFLATHLWTHSPALPDACENCSTSQNKVQRQMNLSGVSAMSWPSWEPDSPQASKSTLWIEPSNSHVRPGPVSEFARSAVVAGAGRVHLLQDGERRRQRRRRRRLRDRVGPEFL